MEVSGAVPLSRDLGFIAAHKGARRPPIKLLCKARSHSLEMPRVGAGSTILVI